MSFLLVSLMHSDHYRGYYFRKVALSATRAENTFSTITILEKVSLYKLIMTKFKFSRIVFQWKILQMSHTLISISSSHYIQNFSGSHHLRKWLILTILENFWRIIITTGETQIYGIFIHYRSLRRETSCSIEFKL